MLLTDEVLRTIAIERATSAGVASDMALVGGMPATFDPVRLDDAQLLHPVAAAPPGDAVSMPPPASAAAPTPVAFDFPSPLVSSGFSAFGGAATPPATSIGPVALGTMPTGSGSVTPALAGAADTIGTSAAALAAAVGNLTDLLRAETPAAAPHLEQLQTQLQSLGAQAQQLAGGPPAMATPVDVASSIVAGTALAAEAITAGATAVIAGTVDTVVETVAAIPALAAIVTAPVATIANATVDAVADTAQSVVDGVTETVVAPVVDTVAEVTETVVAPVVETVAEVTETIVAPVAGTVADVTEAIVAPVAQGVAATVETVADTAGDAIDLVGSTATATLDAASPVVAAGAATVGHVTAALPSVAMPLASTITDTAQGAVTQTIATVAPTVEAIAAPAIEAVAGAVDAADAPFGGTDPLGGMATLHDLLAGEESFELVDAVADAVVFASAGAAEPEHDMAAPLDTLVTTPVETLLGVADDDDHHGLLGGLGLGFEHG